MRFRLVTKVGAVAVAGGLVLAGGIAYAASASSPAASAYCVKFGSGTGAAGNVVEYNWDGAACPAGTYPHSIADPDAAVTAPISPSPSASGSGTSPADDDSAYLKTADLPKDTDSFLPVNFNTGHAPNSTSPADTTFTITDNSNEPAVVYTCHLTVPTGTPLVPGIVCTKNP